MYYFFYLYKFFKKKFTNIIYEMRTREVPTRLLKYYVGINIIRK